MENALLFERYLRDEKRRSPHSCLAYLTDLAQFHGFLSERFPELEEADLGQNHVRAWLASLATEGLQPASIRRKISALRTYYSFLQRSGLRRNNPAKGLLLPKLPKRLPTVVRPAELSELALPPADDVEYDELLECVLIRCFYELGLRRSELITLQQRHVDLLTCQLKVLGKGGKERIIPFGKELSALLLRYLLKRDAMQLECSGFMFVSSKSKPLYARQIYQIVHRWLGRRTTTSKRSPHVLRHSFATHLADSGADINAIKTLLGHATLGATQVYVHSSIEQLLKTYQSCHPRAET
ncbi:MAG: tyrosine-type recombinase/integrase [Saprospiraceae bacterium]|nr:tyrosine-type recombinase/integrase [Saprospiraceae bacterium]